MKRNGNIEKVIMGTLMLTLVILGGCSLPEPPQTQTRVPAQFADARMPEGWWSDKTIISEGRKLYLGQEKALVNCSECHGKDGRPIKGRARNFKDANVRATYSDGHLLWRVSEGVPFTRMGPYKERLSEEEIWKVIAFIGTLGPTFTTNDNNTMG